MKDINVSPLVNNEDVKKLEEWRRRYLPADLEIPHGYNSAGVETVIARKDDKLTSSATGSLAIVIDPLIADPDASPLDIMSALFKQEAVLTYLGQKNGAVDSYIAIPHQLKGYIKLLQRCGYQPTVENCVVMRRPLRPDTVPLLGLERDKVLEELRLEKEKEDKK